jgi:hypothetical protein
VAACSFSLVTSSKDSVAKIKLVVQYEANKEAETYETPPVTIMGSDPIFWLLLAPSTDLLVRFFGNKALA